ncbi:MAG: hypothetical protein HYS52_01285 [Candidatus Wildermuthbacteria bacterium]|nr:hypothetical protein [Candidatus Wildermuthbacteria bacterium]
MRIRRKYKELAKTILLFLATAGVVAVAATSPLILVALLKRMGKRYPTKAEERRKIATAFYRLKKSRLIVLNKKKDGTFLVELTENGKQRAKEIRYQDIFIQRPKHWDGLWRIVIFDIPDKQKNAREALRNRLREWNFFKLQESVWACPWPCEKEIELVVALFQLYPFVNIIHAKSIKNDAQLKAHFKLLSQHR